jgi:hypothetical protein
MKPVAFASLIFLGAHCAEATKLAAHPIESTIQLLQGLEEKVKQEGQTEEVTYSKFESWCSNSIKTLDSAIANGETKADELTSTIAATTEQEARLAADIEELSAELEKFAAAGKQADDMRAEAAALYTTSDADFASTVSALKEAIAALEGAKTSADSSALVQVQTKIHNLIVYPLLLERLGDAGMDALFTSQPLALSKAAPAPAPKYDDLFAKGDFAKHTKKYDFKSNSVSELLKELKTKFENDQLENTKGETNSLNAHSLAKQARDSAIQATTDAQKEKTTLLGETQSALAEAKASLADTQENLKADRGNLADTKKSCDMKKSEWAERSEIRDHEIKAMQEAVMILSEVSGVRTEAPSNPVLPPSPLAAKTALLKATLLQATKPDPKMMKAVNLLREEAHAAHSRSLEQFAEEIKAHLTGPFDDVNNMIQKMIFRLIAEQKDEDEHKNWCDLEMSKTNTSMTDKSEKITALTLKIEAGRASAEALTNEIKTANEMVATLTEHMAEAADIRASGKAENAVAIKDAADAQRAIAKATAVLEAHYKETGMMKKEAWEFLESATGQPVSLPVEPSTWDAAYVGVADPAAQPSGVVAILKQISADFARMEADTAAQEEVDKTAYEEDTKSCEIEKARRSKEAEMKGEEKKRLMDKIGSLEKTQKHVQDELATVKQYLKDLGPACIEGDSTYDQRKTSRAAEISALKEAQTILADAFKEASGAAPAPSATALLAFAPHQAGEMKRAPIQKLRR